MEVDFTQEDTYLLAKKKVKKIKDFYKHLLVYVIVNIFLSSVIIFGITNDGKETFIEALGNFGVYSTWIFWGIGVFFHALGTFDLGNMMSKKWEQNKIEELIRKEEERKQRMYKR